jgi:uncharacterized small protein (TIGR04563 family)
MAQTTDKRKQSLYFPEEMLREIQEQATRQDRSLSWIMQQAWRSASAQMAKLPGMEDLDPSSARPVAAAGAEANGRGQAVPS